MVIRHGTNAGRKKPTWTRHPALWHNQSRGRRRAPTRHVRAGAYATSAAAELVASAGCNHKRSQGRNRQHGSQHAYLHRGASYGNWGKRARRSGGLSNLCSQLRSFGITHKGDPLHGASAPASCAAQDSRPVRSEAVRVKRAHWRKRDRPGLSGRRALASVADLPSGEDGGLSMNSSQRSPYLDVAEVAARLRCSTRSIHELTRHCAIPHRKLPGGRRCLFLEDELRTWEDGAELYVVERPAGGRIVRPVVPEPQSKEAP